MYSSQMQSCNQDLSPGQINTIICIAMFNYKGKLASKYSGFNYCTNSISRHNNLLHISGVVACLFLGTYISVPSKLQTTTVIHNTSYGIVAIYEWELCLIHAAAKYYQIVVSFSTNIIGACILVKLGIGCLKICSQLG